jgi:ribosomal protein S2
MQYWITSRHSYPRAVFTPSVCESYSPVSEAFFSNIPCFGVVDTNAYTNTVSIAFPGNDDSLDCLSLYNELAVNYILIKKFKIVMFWFTFIREYKAIINFKNKVKSLGTDGLDTKIENGIKDRLRL